MGQENPEAVEGTTHRVVCILIALCLESILTAFPTIELYSGVQNTGIPIEGIRIEAIHALPRRDTDTRELWTAGPAPASPSPHSFEEFSTAASPVPEHNDDLGHIDAGWTGWVIVPARTPADLPFTSSTVWTATMAYPGDGSLRPYRRYLDSYR